METTKRPAVGALKRPAAAADRPGTLPDEHKGTSSRYNGGKVGVSAKKRGYRTFRRKTDVVDYCVMWNRYDTRDEAWSAALDLIDEADGKSGK